MILAGALTSVLLGALPLADLWPYQVVRLPDGSFEYSYDVTPLLHVKGSADARAAHGEAAVMAFLESLPKEVKVRVINVPGLVVSAGRGVEPTPLATSFAETSEVPIRSKGRPKGMQMRFSLHPDTPKLLPSVDSLVFSARQVEWGTMAAIAVEVDGQRTALLNRLLDASLARLRELKEGDAYEGALALGGRAAAALACVDPKKIPAKVRAHKALFAAADADVQSLLGDRDYAAIPRPFSNSAELRCVWLRAWATSRRFPNTRGGAVAVLQFIEQVRRDGAAKKAWQQILARRDRYFGTPEEDRISLWIQKAGDDPGAYVERLSDFLESLPYDDRVPPELISAPSTPFSVFRHGLRGRERSASVEELAAAVADGRIELPATKDTPWPVLREGVLAPMLTAEGADVQFDSHWRDRLVGTFATLVNAHHEAQGDGRERELETEERTEMKLRLMVPPHLEAEPLVFLYARQAASLDRLAALLQGDKLAGLKVYDLDGKKSAEGSVPAAKRWASILRGLALLAAPEVRKLAGADVAAARAFLQSWRGEAAMRADVRSATVNPVATGEERQHSAITGVARRELAVTYTEQPALISKLPNGFTLTTDAEQRYIVPVLHTVQVRAPSSAPPLTRAALSKAVDKVGREPDKVEGAFMEAVSPAP